jgi:hypothetical protein
MNNYENFSIKTESLWELWKVYIYYSLWNKDPNDKNGSGYNLLLSISFTIINIILLSIIIFMLINYFML